MVCLEGNMSLKNPVTPPGIDPGTVRLVVQHLNHYATIITDHSKQRGINFIQYLLEISPAGLQMKCVDKQPYLCSCYAIMQKMCGN